MAPKRRTAAQKGPDQKKAKPDTANTVKQLLETGSTYCEELGIDLQKGGSDALFQWLCSSIIFSIGIAESLTFRAAKGLLNNGLNTPKSVKEADMREKIDAVNSEGSVQRGPSMSSRLEAAADLLLEKYDGDLYKLRESAERDPEKERKLLKEFKGLGDAAVSIFCREAQLVWNELYPCLDERTLKSTAKAGLPPRGSAKELAELVGNDRTKFVKLLAAAVKADLRGGKPSNGSSAKRAAKKTSAGASAEGGKDDEKEAAGDEEEVEDEEAELDDEGADAEDVTKADDEEEPEADDEDDAEEEETKEE